MFKTLYTTLSKRVRAPFVSEKPTKTIQEPKDACDINNIVDLYCRQGRAAELLTIQPWQGEDLSMVPDNYMDCLEFIQCVQEDFDNLPASVRKEVGNNPLGMLHWIMNPANKERGVELGIFEKPFSDNLPFTGDSLVTPERVPLEPEEVSS